MKISMPTRTQALRFDSVVQSIWVTILCVAYVSGRGDESSDLALALLVAWQIVSGIVFLASSPPRPRWVKRARIVLLVGLLVAALLCGVGGVVVGMLKLISLGMADVDFDGSTGRALILPVSIAGALLALWDAWGKAKTEVATGPPVLPSAPAMVSANLTEKASPPSTAVGSRMFIPSWSRLWSWLRPWLRYLAPNLLLVAALNALYVDLEYQITGEEWLPVVLCLLTLLLGWICSLGKRNLMGWVHALWARLWWAAAIPLAFLLLTCLPPVRRGLVLHDHGRADGWQSFTSPLGLAQRRHLYTQEYSEALLIRPGIIEQRLARYESFISPYTELWPDRHELALYFAALRLRGESLDAIATRPLGPHLITAALLAEADPPYWVPKAGWLLGKLQASPVGTFRLGIVDRRWAQDHLHTWCDEAHLGAILTREASDKYDPREPGAEVQWREHGRHGCLVRGLLQVSFQHHGLIDETALAWVIAQQVKYAAPTEALTGLNAALEAREAVRDWAAKHADADGRLPLTLDFASTAPPYHTSREALSEGITGFLRHCGYEPVASLQSGGGATITIDLVARTFEGIHYSTESQTERQSTETFRRLSGTRYTRPTTETRLVTHRDSRVSEQLGTMTLPSLSLRFGEETYILPPAMLVDQGSSDTALSHLPPGTYPPSTDATAVINLYYHCHDAALSPWRLALPGVADPDSLLHLDDWEDVPREIREWD